MRTEVLYCGGFQIAKSEKTRNGGQWTEARYRTFIVSALRKASSRYPPKFEKLASAKTEKKVNPQTGRIAQHYKCASCQKDFTQKDVQVDHISPVVGPEGFINWDTYISRMFCEADNLQVLCKECHGFKTKMEREKS